MAEKDHVFFVDDDLIERLMRGDAVDDPSKKKRPASVSALAKAVNLASEGKLDEAIKELEEAGERGENPAEVYTGLGHLRFEEKNWEKAAKCYGKVAQLEPKHRTASYNLALVLERQDKFEEAAKEFENAVAVDGKRWQAMVGRGLCLLHLGKPEQALECFEPALKENASHDQALFGKAVALQQLGKLDEALDVYKKLLPANPNSPELLGNLIALSAVKKDDVKVKEFSERL